MEVKGAQAQGGWTPQPWWAAGGNPNLIDEEDLGSHVYPHAGDSADSGVHAWKSECELEHSHGIQRPTGDGILWMTLRCSFER